ncbi:MAG: hypothetical protein Tsb0021_17560 [Chlamydiales bacterium]
MGQLKDHEVVLCLPYVALEAYAPLFMGPVTFFSAHLAQEYLDPDTASWLLRYLEGHSLTPRQVTCMALQSSVPEEKRISLIVDALYLFYFTFSSRSLYTSIDPPFIDTFTKVIPAEEKYTRAMVDRELSSLSGLGMQQALSVDAPEGNLLSSLGSLLDGTILIDHEKDSQANRLIRAMRYFVDRRMCKFENIVQTGLQFPKRSFDPEEIIFLITAFETLLSMDGDTSVATLKQKLRPVLVLNYSKPIEMLWKWIEGFHHLHTDVVHGTTILDDEFKENPSFTIRYTDLGAKIFIYSVLEKLCHLTPLQCMNPQSDTPSEYRGFPPQEIHLFLWSESDLLRKISVLMLQVTEGETSEDILHDLSNLSKVYYYMMQKYILAKSHPAVSYHRHDPKSIVQYGKAIINLASQTIQRKEKTLPLSSFLPDLFIEDLKRYIDSLSL